MKIIIFTILFALIYPSPITTATDIWEKKKINFIGPLNKLPTNKDKPLNKYERMNGRRGGQCVVFIQNQFKPNKDFTGIAGKIKPNATDPKIGQVVITKEGQVGHVALIINITDKTLVLAESNMIENDGIIRVGRHLRKDSERIIGYFNF